MTIIVQKFGGTSVGGGERMLNVAKIIEGTLADYQVVAVVSAMSYTDKSLGTTTLLLQAARQASQGEPFNGPLDTIRRQHLEALEQAVSAPRYREELEAFIEKEMEWLTGFLDAIEVIRELSPRSQDVLLSTGEQLAARMLVAALEDRGIPAEMIDLVEVVPESEKSINPAFFHRLQGLLAELCRPHGGKVPVVTGFLGLVPGGLLRTVGRGYSDFTAALISAGLGKEQVLEMQVWKEVEGIFTADPRRVPKARVLKKISPSEASELTYFGSEVLHPFTMERVVAAQVPIRIKNTFNPAGEGTVILHDAYSEQEKIAQVTAVTAKRGISIFTVQSNRMYNAHGFMARVFKVLEDHSVNVDLISTSEVSISCTVDRLEELNLALTSLEQLGAVSVIPGRAILAMVGEGMKFAMGTAGKMFSTLGSSEVNIEMISQGASEINISCVIKEGDTETGLRAIHRAFLENP